jgi:peptidyl-prolyl cis-trans isomerase SurA
MAQKLKLVVWFVPLFAVCALYGAETVDRIVATVNGRIILQSDWDDAVRYEFFMAAKPLGQASSSDRKAVLNRLIDQELLREQMNASEMQPPAPEEIEKQFAEVRQKYDPSGNDQAWQTALAHYHLTAAELKSRISTQLGLMRLVDTRLRPSVQVDTKSIESYYNQELLPQIEQSGGKSVPLAAVSPKIREVLTQQRVSELLLSWLQNLRAESDIHSAFTASSPGDERR